MRLTTECTSRNSRLTRPKDAVRFSRSVDMATRSAKRRSRLSWHALLGSDGSRHHRLDRERSKSTPLWKRCNRQNDDAIGRHGARRWGRHDRGPPCAGPTTNSANLLLCSRPTRRSKLPSGCTVRARPYAARRSGCATRACYPTECISISRWCHRGCGCEDRSVGATDRRSSVTTARVMRALKFGKYLILFWNQASEANVAGNAERDVI